MRVRQCIGIGTMWCALVGVAFAQAAPGAVQAAPGAEHSVPVQQVVGGGAGAVPPAAVPAQQSFTSNLGQGVIFTVRSLKRSAGNSVVLKGVLENTTAKEVYCQACFVSDDFRADLQDLEGGKQYKQLKIEHEWVGYRKGINDPLTPFEKREVWARITAPPAHVQKVSIVFRHTGAPIDDVPIEP